MTTDAGAAAPEPQGVLAELTGAAIFIGYARSPATIEQMLVNMFVGVPEGNYGRLLDVSTAVTGNLFFVPSVPVLDSLADGPPPASETSSTRTPPARSGQAGSLNIGSLKGASGDG